MSKRRQPQRPIEKPSEQVPVAAAPAPETIEYPPVAFPDIEWFRRCPSCWPTLHGVGIAYTNKRLTPVTSERYYKCDQCAKTWVATVKNEVTKVEHRTVELHER